MTKGSPSAAPRLCLVGMSGVGKSFWAKRLAERGLVRHDCDGAIGARLGAHVERSGIAVGPGEEPVHALGRWMGMPWSPGYAEREAEYLALEAEVTREALEASLSEASLSEASLSEASLSEVSPARGHVIDATGSVIYLAPALLERLRAAHRVIHLRTPEARRDAMLARYLAEPKPVVWGGAFRVEPGERPEEALPRCYAALLAWREERYAALAHVTLDGGELEARDPGIDGFLRAAGIEP